MIFDPFKLLFKNLEVHRDSNSQSGSPLRSVWADSITFYRTLGNVNVIHGLDFRPAPFHAPCFGHEPKAKVMTPPISYNLPTFIPHILIMKCQN